MLKHSNETNSSTSLKQIQKQLEIKQPNNKAFRCIVALTNNKISSGNNDGSISIYHIDLYSNKYKLLSQKEKAHNETILYLNAKSETNQLISCSTDELFKLWRIINFTQFILEGVFIGHQGAVIQALFINECKVVSCSWNDTTIRIWNCLDFQCESVFKQNNEKPFGVLYLKSKQLLIVSYPGNISYMNVYNSCSPYQLIKRVNDISGWWNGMIELSDGNIAISQRNPPRICIVDSVNFNNIIEIVDSEYISRWGALSVLNCNSFIYVRKGKMCQIIFDAQEKKYKINSLISMDDTELDGYTGIINMENGKYFIANNGLYPNYNLIIYKCLY